MEPIQEFTQIFPEHVPERIWRLQIDFRKFFYMAKLFQGIVRVYKVVFTQNTKFGSGALPGLMLDLGLLKII